MMIPFSLVLLWKNEKKLVTYAKVINAIQKECVTIDPEKVEGTNVYNLVHVVGTTEHADDIVD